jgi:hypothetical protein
MTYNFMIAIDSGTAEQQDAITAHLQRKGYRVWHWIENLWLLAQVPVGTTPKMIWEQLDALPEVGSIPMLITASNGASSFYGRLAPHAWKWMAEYWGHAG